MPNLIVVDRSGSEHSVEGQEGYSIMEILRENGFDDVQALCGGCCSCATCHVHVDDAHWAQLTPMTEDEDDLLDSSDHRTATSRLSCQIPFTAALDGIRVEIAAED